MPFTVNLVDQFQLSLCSKEFCVSSYLLKCPTSSKKIILLFSDVSHFYIIPDSIFVRIENEVSSKSAVINPYECDENFKTVETVLKLGSDLEAYECKTTTLGIPKHRESHADPGTVKTQEIVSFCLCPARELS